MEEYFYFLRGEELVIVDGRELLYGERDFLQVKCEKFHTIHAVSGGGEMLTVGKI